MEKQFKIKTELGYVFILGIDPDSQLPVIDYTDSTKDATIFGDYTRFKFVLKILEKERRKYELEEYKGEVIEKHINDKHNGSILDHEIADWVADGKGSIFNQIDGRWIMFQEGDKNKELPNFFEFGFNGIAKVFTDVKENESQKFYEETREFMNKVLKKYGLEEIENA